MLKETKTRILVIIDKEVKSKAAEKAKQDGRSLSNYIAELVRKSVE